MGASYDFSSWSVSEIKARLRELRKARAAIEAEELALVAALDSANLGPGNTSTASMLAAEGQISCRTAKKMVEMANSLRELPLLSDALSSGEISSEVAREVATFATPESEAALVEVARNWSAGEARQQAREARAIPEAEQREINASVELKLRWNRAKTAAEIYGRLSSEGAAKVEASLGRIVGRLDKEVGGERVPFPARMAEALVLLASTNISRDSDPDRANVNLHIDYETLVANSGNAEIGGGYVSPEIARRISCDPRLRLVLDDPYGLPLGIGRTSRKIPPWLGDQIRYRDKACIYPGCERDFGVDIHHIIHWADGGPTDYDNLALLCWGHHRLVHEGGWKLSGSVTGGLVFTGLWGEQVAVAPWVKRRVKLKRGLGGVEPAAAGDSRAGDGAGARPSDGAGAGDSRGESGEQRELLPAGRSPAGPSP